MGCCSSKTTQVSQPGHRAPETRHPTLLDPSTKLQEAEISKTAAAAQATNAESENTAEAHLMESTGFAVDLSARNTKGVETAKAGDAEPSEQVPSPMQGMEAPCDQPLLRRGQTWSIGFQPDMKEKEAPNAGKVPSPVQGVEARPHFRRGQTCSFQFKPDTREKDPLGASAVATQATAKFGEDEEVARASEAAQTKKIMKVGKILSFEFVQGQYVYEVEFTEEIVDVHGDLVEKNTVEKIREEDLVEVAMAKTVVRETAGKER